MVIPDNVLNESIMEYHSNIYEYNEKISIIIINNYEVCHILRNSHISLNMRYQGIAYAVLKNF